MSEHVNLSNGALLPTIALGTWKSKPGDVGKAVKVAIRSGYRHIDCASNYLNEAEIGDALTDLFQEGVVKREDVFITGKLNNPYHEPAHVKPHLLKTLKDLCVEQLDLYLMHWPVAFHHVPFDEKRRGFGADYDPDDSGGGAKINHTVSIEATWRAMEALVDEGLVKAIGVSNFTAILLHDLLTYAKHKPVVLQVESHPYLQQPSLLKFAASHGIVVEAYSPLGSPDFNAGQPVLLHDPTLRRIAAEHGVSVAQVCLRWAVQRGTVALPKSVTPARIKANRNVYGFSLSDEDMADIAALDRDVTGRILTPKKWYKVPLFTP